MTSRFVVGVHRKNVDVHIWTVDNVADLSSVIEVHTRRTVGNQTSEHSRYFLTSLPLNAERALRAARFHWGIEAGVAPFAWTPGPLSQGAQEGCPYAPESDADARRFAEPTVSSGVPRRSRETLARDQQEPRARC